MYQKCRQILEFLHFNYNNQKPEEGATISDNYLTEINCARPLTLCLLPQMIFCYLPLSASEVGSELHLDRDIHYNGVDDDFYVFRFVSIFLNSKLSHYS